MLMLNDQRDPEGIIRTFETIMGVRTIVLDPAALVAGIIYLTCMFEQ